MTAAPLEALTLDEELSRLLPQLPVDPDVASPCASDQDDDNSSDDGSDDGDSRDDDDSD
ncbi:MAG: hypothetical protein ACR2ND_03050 [Solirubrobacteraceae bacterium]